MQNSRKSSQEKFIGSRPPAVGRVRVHLVYPNSYRVAMSSLAFQAMFSVFGSAGASVERVFEPEAGGVWCTHETGRRAGDCDLLAFSISFEGDYLNALRCLNTEGLLSFDACSRLASPNAPLLIAGGAAVTLNPEPLADFFDLLCIGEAEEFVPELLTTLTAGQADREHLLRSLASIEGAYVPWFIVPHYGSGGAINEFRYLSDVPRPKRRFLKDLSRYPTCSQILSDQTEFKSIFLAEVGRGCENGCKFCAAGYMYRPVRKQSAEVLTTLVNEGLRHTSTIGLVGSAVSSHRALLDLCRQVSLAGGRATLSSLMAQRVTPELASALGRFGNRSVALAPEAGPEALRFAIGKRVSDETFIRAAQELSSSGLRSVKLYFMIGLPGEGEDGVEAIVALSRRISEALGGLTVSLSVAPFIPKPFTPFQWEAMLDRRTLERRMEGLRRAVAKERRLEIAHESVRESQFQALLSRADRRLCPILHSAARQGEDWKWVIKKAITLKPVGLEWYVHRKVPFNQVLPWDVVDSGISKDLLMREAGA